MEPKIALCAAVVEGFSLLGSPTEKALLEQLDFDGIHPLAGIIDVKLLDVKLKEVFGSGSEPLMKVIYDRFVDKLGKTDGLSFPSSMPMSERILQILEKRVFQ